MNKIKVSFILNILIVLLVIFGCFLMFSGIKIMPSKDLLQASKIEMFKFYTVDSNILVAISSLILLISEYKLLKNNKYIISNKVYIFKLVSVSCISLTFLTTVLFLAPNYGFYEMFNNANLFFHLIVPVLSIISYVLFEKHDNKYKYGFLGIIPMAIYSIYYVGNILIHLDGNNVSFKYDFYGFLGGKLSNGIIVFPLIYIVSYSFCMLLIFLNKKIFIKK